MTDPRAAVFDTARYKRGRVEGDRLTRALVEAASKGLRPNCRQPETHHYWTSEHDSERAQAALWCTGCVVFEPCGEAAAARQERFGVWASVDRTRHANGKAPGGG
jgi:hypothetical protein